MKIEDKEKKATFIIISEILFALLPLIVIFSIMIATSENVLCIFTKGDISFISVFFFGQALVKFFSGISKSKTRKKWQVIMFFVSILFIIGVVPSIIWLCIIYLEAYKNKVIYIFQFLWFCFSMITYFVIGKIGLMYLDEDSTN